MKKIIPAFEKDNNLVVMSSDDDYALYLGVCIQSLIDRRNNKINYDIVVLEDGITENNKRLISSLSAGLENVSIRFFDMRDYIEKYQEMLYLSRHLSKATYYRFFIPEIFAEYTRAVYLDCDIIVLKDISYLFSADMGSKLIFAVPDISLIKKVSEGYREKGWKNTLGEYMNNILHLDDVNTYFQAGMLVLNISGLKEFKMTEKCISCLRKIGQPYFHDQDILNSVLSGYVGYLDLKWNHLYTISDLNEIKDKVPAHLFDEFVKSQNGDACILHFITDVKPWWLCTSMPYAEYFWQAARKTPFYEILIQKNLKRNEENLLSLIYYRKNFIKYRWYSFLEMITFGSEKFAVRKGFYREKVKRARYYKSEYKKTIPF